MRTELHNMCGISHFIPQTMLKDGTVMSTLKVIKLPEKIRQLFKGTQLGHGSPKIQSQECFRQTPN